MVKEEGRGQAGLGKLRAKPGEDWDVAFGVTWRLWASWSGQFLWSQMMEDAATSEVTSSLPQPMLRTWRWTSVWRHVDHD